MSGIFGIPPGVWSFLLTVLLSGTLVVVGSFLIIRWFPSEKKASAGGGIFGLTTVMFFFFILMMSPLPGAIAVGLGYKETTVALMTIAVQVLVGVVATRSLR